MLYISQGPGFAAALFYSKIPSDPVTFPFYAKYTTREKS